ncbi:hypothetical protein V2J09_000330 [Rumex salicifolius]
MEYATSPVPLKFPLSHPTYTIWGANTDVGKTLVSAGLASSILLSSPTSKLNYIKPVQTGFPTDSDAAFVYRKVSEFFLCRRPPGNLLASNDTLRGSEPAALKARIWGNKADGNGLRDLGLHEETKLIGDENSSVSVSRELVCTTLCAWRDPISPHLAVEREGGAVSDDDLVEMLQNCLWKAVGGDGKEEVMWSLIETAGGVASPGPSGTLQCDLYRPFRSPAVLVGDGRLGGIAATISAYETLKLRGYDVEAIILIDGGLMNDSFLLNYLRNSMPVLLLPPVPEDLSDNLMDWYDKSLGAFSSLKQILLSAFIERVERLRSMSQKAGDIFWWPFTQHQLVPKEKVTVIDSRHGETFGVYKVHDHDLISQQVDACASWWTQGPDSTLQIELAREMGYVAARYGHVMFPENVHEPALECAELLLEGVGKGWASRTYFSDNGSTAIEIALKMAFRKFLSNYGILLNPFQRSKTMTCLELKVLALEGSYHGDTLGAMEAQAPSSYTGFFQQPWYTGRGVFMDPPTVYMHNGMWNLSLPKWLHWDGYRPDDCTFRLREEVFNKNRDGSHVAKHYISYISEQLSPYLEGNIVQGAGGMLMIDPLFQRVLVVECRNHKIPVIFDEVFTGFWRLGVESAAELLHCSPDIACYAKLMTGGLIPLAVTLAKEEVFTAFLGDSKLKALLHGHSYTAHAMGCAAARRSIKWFKNPETNVNLTSGGKSLKELWDAQLVEKISSHPTVKRVVVLGTLFALELKAEGSNAGYASVYASSLVQSLREDGIYMRPLGNVIYMMCGPCTSTHLCSQLLEKLKRRLDEFHQEASIVSGEV